MGDQADKVMEISDLSDGFAYMPNLQKGVAYVPQYGACDPLMRDQYQRETPFRFATGFFRWTRNAGTGALELSSGSSVTLFGSAAGTANGAAAAGGGNAELSRADTNAFDQGGVAKQGNQFIAVAVNVQPLAPFIVASNAVCSGSTAVRRRAHWFQGGTDYPAECVKLLFDSVSAQLQHGSDTACQYNLGPLSHWIASSPTSQEYRSVAGIPGAFTYLAVPDISGNRNAGDNFNLVLSSVSALAVESDPVNPTVAGFDFVTPVRFALVGFPVCGDGTTGAACAPAGNGSTEARMAKMERMLGDFFARMSGQDMSALPSGEKPAMGYGRRY